jgi:hypothetical protein
VVEAVLGARPTVNHGLFTSSVTFVWFFRAVEFPPPTPTNASVLFYTKRVCFSDVTAAACLSYSTASAQQLSCCGMTSVYNALGVLSVIAVSCEALGGALSCCGVRGVA